MDDARTGDWFLWFGQQVYEEDFAAVEQYVTIEEGSPPLSFYLRFMTYGSSGEDFFRVLMDGVEIFYTGTFGHGYELVQVDLSSFADGGSHLLRIEAKTVGLMGLYKYPGR